MPRPCAFSLLETTCGESSPSQGGWDNCDLTTAPGSKCRIQNELCKPLIHLSEPRHGSEPLWGYWTLSRTGSATCAPTRGVANISASIAYFCPKGQRSTSVLLPVADDNAEMGFLLATFSKSRCTGRKARNCRHSINWIIASHKLGEV